MSDDASDTTESMPFASSKTSSITRSSSEGTDIKSGSLSSTADIVSTTIVESPSNYPTASTASHENESASALKSSLSNALALVSSTTPTVAPTRQTGNENSDSRLISTQDSKYTSTLPDVSSFTQPGSSSAISSVIYPSGSSTFGSSIVISTYAGSAARSYLNHAITLIVALPLAFL